MDLDEFACEESGKRLSESRRGYVRPLESQFKPLRLAGASELRLVQNFRHCDVAASLSEGNIADSPHKEAYVHLCANGTFHPYLLEQMPDDWYPVGHTRAV